VQDIEGERTALGILVGFMAICALVVGCSGTDQDVGLGFYHGWFGFWGAAQEQLAKSGTALPSHGLESDSLVNQAIDVLTILRDLDGHSFSDGWLRLSRELFPSQVPRTDSESYIILTEATADTAIVQEFSLDVRGDRLGYYSLCLFARDKAVISGAINEMLGLYAQELDCFNFRVEIDIGMKPMNTLQFEFLSSELLYKTTLIASRNSCDKNGQALYALQVAVVRNRNPPAVFWQAPALKPTDRSEVLAYWRIDEQFECQ
jgi:hypothetical protein